MKFMHLSDLHLGRLLHRFQLDEEQNAVLEMIRQIAAAEKPDAVVIAGDVYDRGIPPVYATQSLDHFLQGLAALGIPVMMISGNHDSAERLGFLSGVLEKSGLHISPAYRGQVKPVTLLDDEGPVDFWLLPFVKAATVRPYFPEEEIATTSEAVGCAIAHMEIDRSRRNVLVAHQFVAGGTLIGSEESVELITGDVSVGGVDMVDARLFAPFDYTALGHLHHAQNVGSERIRYCGTPLKYSFSEVRDEKSVTMVELRGDRSLEVSTIPLPAPREMQELRGSFEEIASRNTAWTVDRDAYTRVILTDDAPIPDVINRLRAYYPNLARLDWDNLRTRHVDDFAAVTEAERHTPYSLLEEFFQRTNGCAMSQEQSAYADEMIRSIWEVME